MQRRKPKKNKLQERLSKMQKIKNALIGEGEYIFKNNTSGELFLPKESLDGKIKVAKGETWKGDNYFMYMHRNNEAILVETLVEPNNQKENRMENKLILDQPETFTTQGAVEHIEVKTVSASKLNEVIPNEELEEEKEKLINEDPMDGIQIIFND